MRGIGGRRTRRRRRERVIRKRGQGRSWEEGNKWKQKSKVRREWIGGGR